MADFVPPLFKNFGKTLADLFKEQFDFKKQVKVKSTTSNGLTLTSAAETTSKAGEFQGSIKATHKSTDIGTFEAEISTSGATKYSVKADKLTKGLAVKVSGDEKPAGRVEVDYAQEFFAGSLNVDVAKDSTAGEVAGVVGYDGMSVGGQVKYDITRQALADFNAGAEYAGSDFTATVKTTEQANKISTSYIHKYNSDLSLGANFEYDIESGKRVFTVGDSYKVDAQIATKFKINTLGVLGAVLEHKLRNPNIKTVFSAEFNAKQASTVPEKFGLAFHFGDD